MNDLLILDALLRERSLTRTAHRLGVTQPAVSKTLNRLRRQFADPLFVRQGQGVEPTARALGLAAGLADLLQAADALRSIGIGFDPGRSDREFGVLMSDVGAVHFLPPLLNHLATGAPSVRLRVVPLDARRIETKLESGEADVALGAFSQAVPHLRRQRLYHDGYRSLVRADHPRLPGLHRIAGFVAERHILVTASDTGHAAHSSAQRALLTRLLPQNVMLRVPSFVAGAIVSAETDGVVTVPTALARRLAGRLGLVSFRPPLDLPRIEIAQYWHERFHRDAANRWLRAAVTAVFQRRTDPARTP